jgi:hypothetical protein
MKAVNESKSPVDVQPALKITNEGAVTKRTHGVAWPFPYYELGAPPYDHFWPPSTTN